MADRILIIKLGALGDIVMSTALLKGIMSKHTDAKCTLLTTDEFKEIFSQWKNLTIKTFPRRGIYHNTRTLKWIRSQAFTHLYDLQGSNRTRIMAKFSQIPIRVGNSASSSYTHHPKQPWLGNGHIFNRMIEVCNSAGVIINDKLPYFPPNPQAAKKIESWLHVKNLHNKKIVLLHAGASPKRPEKKWPYFPELAIFLLSRNVIPVWIGGESDRQLNLTLSNVAGIDATAEFSISELPKLGRFADFAVTNDSGPMHVLSAANIPVFGIFGPSDWTRNHALGQKKHVIALNKTHPESLQIASLHNIKPSVVIDSIKEFIY